MVAQVQRQTPTFFSIKYVTSKIGVCLNIWVREFQFTPVSPFMFGAIVTVSSNATIIFFLHLMNPNQPFIFEIYECKNKEAIESKQIARFHRIFTVETIYSLTVAPPSIPELFHQITPINECFLSKLLLNKVYAKKTI